MRFDSRLSETSQIFSTWTKARQNHAMFASEVLPMITRSHYCVQWYIAYWMRWYFGHHKETAKVPCTLSWRSISKPSIWESIHPWPFCHVALADWVLALLPFHNLPQFWTIVYEFSSFIVHDHMASSECAAVRMADVQGSVLSDEESASFWNPFQRYWLVLRMPQFSPDAIALLPTRVSAPVPFGRN